MQNAEHDGGEHERQLDRIIAEYLRASDEGRPQDQADVLRQHPEFAAELRDFFSDAGQIEKFALTPEPAPDETQPFPHPSSILWRPGTQVRYFGDYEVLEELGYGGMGVVYKARQTKLNKIVALKMIRVGHLAGEEEVRRFRAEARAAAKLNHPGIVPVHEIGVDHGQHYYTMDYVGGGSLSKLHRDEPMAARRAAEIIKQMAEAMHYAHGQGIVHRDLKPANVLLTAGDVPRITDFGLAKRLWPEDDSDGVSMTETGIVLGTAGYMSPEQAAAKSRLVGPPADIYALGAVLYALLTTRAPFVGESKTETILQVINKEPVSPRVLNPSVARDLETVCLKCLEKEPHKRYGTAELLADDLSRFLDNKPVLARPVSAAERGWRWCCRNPWAATALLLLVILGAGSPPIAYVIKDLLDDVREELRQKNEILAQLAISEEGERAARKLAESETASKNRTLYVADMNRMAALWREAELGTMRMLLARHLPTDGKTDLRDFEWHYWQRKCGQGSQDFVHGREPRLLALSRNGKWLATAGPTEKENHAIKIWNRATGQLENTLLESPAAIVALKFAPEESKLFIVRQGMRDFAEVVDWRTEEFGSQLRLDANAPGAPTSRYVVSPSGKLLARSIMGTVSCLNLERGGPLSIELADDANIPSLRAQGQMVYSSPAGKYIRFEGKVAGIIRFRTGTQIQDIPMSMELERDFSQDLDDELPLPLEEDGGPVFALKFSPAEDHLAAGSRHGELIVWDLSSGKEVIKTQSHTGIIWDLAFSADGKQLATASKDGLVKLWEVPSGKWSATIEAHADGVRAVEFSQQGMLVSGGNDRCVKVWSSVTGDEIATFQGHEHAVLDVAIQTDGETIFSASRDGRVKEWSLSDPDQPIVVANRMPLACLDLFHGSDVVAATGNDSNDVTLWTLGTGQIKANLSGQIDRAFHVKLASDGKSIVSGTWDGTFTTWDIASKKILAQQKLPIMANQYGMPAVAISPSARSVAARCPDGKTKIFELGSVEPTVTLESDALAARIGFSPDGAEVHALTRNEKSFDLRLWNAATGAVTEVIATGVESSPLPAFSNDGKQLAWCERLADQDPFSLVIKVWDRSAKEVRQRLPLKGKVVVGAVAFSPDRSLLAAIAIWKKSQDKEAEPAAPALIVWDVETGRELHHFAESGSGLRFLPDGNTIAVAGESGSVNLWSLAEGRKLRALTRPVGPALSVVFAPKVTALKEPKLLVISRALRPWVTVPSEKVIANTLLACRDPNQQEQTISLTYDDLKDLRIAAQPLADGKLGERGWLKDLLNLDATEVKKLGFVNPALKSIDAYAPEANVVFALAPNGTLVRGRADKRGPVIHADAAVANPADAEAMASAFNGRWVAIAVGNDIQLWDGDKLQLRHTLNGHKDYVGSLAFSPNGDLLATAGSDRSIRLWNTSDGSLRAVLLGHLKPITCLAFSVRGGTLFSSSFDGTIRLWDTTSGEAKTTLIGHVGPVHWIDLSPAGDELATAGDDGTIRLWKAPVAAESGGQLPEPLAGNATAFLPKLGERDAGRAVSLLQPIP